MNHLAIGQVIKLGSHNFEIVSVLGEGADGIVYKTLFDDNVFVVIKMIPTKFFNKNEIQIMSLLRNNKYVPEYYASHQYGDYTLMITEYFQGITLTEYIDFAGGRLKYEVLWQIIEKLIEGIDSIHSLKIAHCDLSQQNIMIDKDLNIKYIDFSRACYDTQCEGPMEPIMINEYEEKWVHDSRYDGQYDTFLEYNQKIDMEGLGNIIFELLVGIKVFKERVSEIFPGNGKRNHIIARSEDQNLNYLIKKLSGPDLRDVFSSKKALNYLNRVLI